MALEGMRFAGAHEVHELLGLKFSRQRLYQITRGATFPPPAAVLAQGKVWLVDEVESWISEHRDAARQPPRR